MRGLDRLQAALDSGEFPASWPADVCRDAWCGHWVRNGGLYYWHRPADHGADNGHAIAPGSSALNGSDRA